ncbi:alanine-zipper protein [Leuconostoc gasicomitatum]|uniref:alanine-zipper protein n=1 Tax=Leuconostoc gasicomitatum TaxID=115778 RepID=UPI001CC70371|nr:hypothetical protein [Leuconostoc gasicomitatum]MBZ5958135.1 hypothetical protein [Leuconostoc gasicomitatum]
MAYTVLNESLQVKGKLTLNNGKGSTAFFADTITQQIATDNSSDPTNATAVAFNSYDKQGNAKQWGHSLTVSVEATDLGSGISTNDYLMYFDDVNNHYYLMKVITAATDRNSGFVTISGVNTAIYELGKQIVNAETTFKQANLQTVVNGLYKNAPFSVVIQDDLATVIDYTVSANTSLQAVLQDLQTKYDVDVDSWIELDESGNISDRIIYFGHIGRDNGELIRYGGAKGFENINAQELSDTIYTKLYVTGLTSDTDPTKGHIGSVNNGMEYILDDNANAKQYAIGASQQQPVYLEGSISNTLLSEPQALLTWANAQMDIFNHPRFNYTVTPLHDQIVGIGDTIAVQDFHIKPEILVTSKVIQKSTSFASPETNTFVLGEFSSIFTENANKGAGVIQLIKKDVTVVQEAADNARVSAEEAHEQAVQAQQAAIHAQTTADGKLVAFTVDSVDDLPATANEGDIAWVTLSDGTHGYTYLKGKWVEDINPTLAKDITDGVNNAVNTSKANSLADIKANNVLINQTINTVSKQQADLAIKAGDFNNKAQAMVNQGVADAKANTQTVAQQTLATANANLAAAKTDLTTGIAKETADRATAVTALDKTAKGYADTAKSDAISAASTADGVINKKIDDTTTSIGVTIAQNKKDANGGISTAQSMAQQGIDGLKTKVSQNDYNLKTGQLQADINTTSQTATQSKQDIVAIKQADSSQDSRMNSIVDDANGTKQTISNIQTLQGNQSGSILTLQKRADGFDATVERVANLSVGGRNLLTNSKIFGFGIGNNSTTSSTKIDFDTTTKMIHITAPAGGSNNAGIYFSQSTHYDTNLITKGQPWSFSMDIKGTGVYSQFGIEGSSPFNKLQGSVPTEWTRVSSTGVASNGKAIIIYFNATTVALDVYIKLIKLEQGSFPTDWTPAPEDVDSATAKAQLTADQATLNLSNYQTSADGRITKAQSDIVVNATAIGTKVSQSDYNTKTGDLTSKVGTAKLTADQAITTIGNYQKSNDGRITTAETNIKSNKDAIALTATKQELNSATSTLNSSIGAVNVKADSVTQIVTSLTNQVNTLGQTNQVHNSQLAPDFSGWHTGSPWGKPLNNEFTKAGVSDSDPYGAAYVYHDYATSGEWIYSDPVDVASKSKVSISISAAVTQAFTTGVPLALYVSGYDNARKKVTSTGYNIPVNQLTGSYTQFKLENVSLDNTVTSVSFTLAWNNTPGKVYMGKPMMVFAPTVGSYVPGQYVNNDKIALQQITIDGITQTVSTQGTNIDSVTKRVQTAEGNLSTATNRITGVESKQTQLSGQFNQEVTDRKNGDSTTLSQAATYTQSQVSSATNGLNSTITQTANAIIANLGASNLFPNSEFTADYGYRSKNGTVTTAQNQNVDNKINGTVTVVSTSAGYQGYWTNNIPVIGGQKYSGATRVHYTNGGLTNGLALLDVWFVDKSGNRINGGTGGTRNGSTSQVSSPYWIDLYFDGITAPINASYVKVSLIVNNAGAGQTATFTQTTITATDVHQPYTPNDGISATLALFKDNWSIGIKDNIQDIVSGIVGTPTQMSLISNNVTINSPKTQINGKAWIQSADIANGAIGTAQIGDATINNAKIANLDASKISSGTIDTSRLNVGQIFAQGISTTNATIGQTLALSAGGKITAPLNGQVWDFSGNPYYYTNSTGGTPWFQVNQTGTFVIDTSGTLQFDGTITAPDVKIGNSVQTAFYTQTADGTLGGTNKLTTSMSFGLNGLRINQDDARGSSYGSGGYAFITGHGFYTGFDQANPRFAVGSDGNVMTDKITFSGGSSYQNIQGSAVNASSIHQEFFNNTYNLYMNSGSGYARIASQGGNGAKLYVNATNITTDSPFSSGNISLNTGHAIVSKDNGKMFFYGSNGNQIDLGVRSLTQSSLVSLKEHIGNIDQTYALNETLKVDVKQYNFIGDNISNRHVSPMIDDVNGKWYIPKDWVSEDGKSVDVYTITGYLIQAIKALQTQITELKQG